MTESEIAKVKKPKNALPNDYETLMAMNREKELELKRQAEENEKKSANQENVAETAPQMPVFYEESSENLSERVERNPRSEGDKYKSAISFALGEFNQNINPNSTDKIKNKCADTKKIGIL